MNLELLNRIWGKIESQPETWNQEFWVVHTPECGTQACVAGWAALLSGWEPVFPSHTFPSESEVFSAAIVQKEYARKDVEEVAAKELVLSETAARWLFNEDRTKGDIERFVNEMNKEEA